MARPVLTSYSRTFPSAPDSTFDAILPTPLPDLFHRTYGPIPPIASVDGQVGTWGTVGQQRTIHLADGGTMHEELTSVDRPSSFGYTITDVTGRMKPLVARVDGLWTCAADGSGTKITWQWTITPASAIAARLMPIFCGLWRSYAARSFDTIGTLLAH